MLALALTTSSIYKHKTFLNEIVYLLPKDTNVVTYSNFLRIKFSDIHRYKPIIVFEIFSSSEMGRPMLTLILHPAIMHGTYFDSLKTTYRHRLDLHVIQFEVSSP